MGVSPSSLNKDLEGDFFDKSKIALISKHRKVRKGMSWLYEKLPMSMHFEVHQKIKEEKMNIDIVERMKQIEIQEEEIQRRKKELDARIKAPADAEKYKSEILASANRAKAVLEAEAQAQAVALKGDAEAFSIEAKAKAEAEGMAQKADAFKDYGKAAKVSVET